MSTEEKLTNGELGIMLSTFRTESIDHRARLETTMEKIEKSVDVIKEQSIKTNGRVNSLEDNVKKLDDRINYTEKGVGVLKGDKKWIMGAFAVIVFLFGIIPYFLSLYIENAVRNVLGEFNIKVSAVQE